NPPGNPPRTRRAGRFFRLQWSHPPTEAMTMARTPSSESRPPRTPRVPAALAGVILSLGMFGGGARQHGAVGAVLDLPAADGAAGFHHHHRVLVLRGGAGVRRASVRSDW